MATSMGAVENYVKGKRDNDLHTIVTGILQKDEKLLDLVENLGPFLTSVDVETRARGTRLLAEVLHRLPNDFLSQQEELVLVGFFCDRLKDHHSVTPHVIFGLYAISTLSSLVAGSATKIAKEIFQHVQVQSLNQADRRYVYQLLANFLSSKLKELQNMGSDFVFGYIQVMDGERDPRNLLIAFQTVTVIIHHFPIKIFAEELFEETSCYFPVDFSPPPDDPHEVTRPDLVSALQDVLSGSPSFAEFAMPQILEKATSDVPSAKIDAFELLSVACSHYGVKGVKEFLGSLFSTIKQEVFTTSNENIESSALKSLTSLISTLSRGDEPAEFESFVTDILKECKHHICQPGLRLIPPCGKILQAAAEGSDPACCRVFHEVIPLLLELFHTRTQALPRKILLKIILDFIKLVKNYSATDVKNPILEYKETLFTIFISLLNDDNPQLRIFGVTGIAGLLALDNILNDLEIQSVTGHLLRLILEDSDTSVRNEVVTVLAFLAVKSPSLVASEVLPVLIEKLKTDSIEVEGVTFMASKKMILHTLASLSLNEDIVKSTIPTTVDQLKIISHSVAQKDSKCYEECQTICHCLRTIVQSNSKPQVLNYFAKTLVPELLRISVKASLQDSENIFYNEDTLHAVAGILREITQKQDTCSCNHFVEVFIHGNLSLLFNEEIIEADKKFCPLDVSSPNQQTQLIILLSAIICSCNESATLTRCLELLSALQQLACQSSNPTTRLAAAKCLAGLVNKSKKDTQTDKFLQASVETLSTSIDAKTKTSHNSLTLWIWLTKALVLKGHPLAKDFSNKLLTLLEDDKFAETASGGLYVIMNEFNDIMTKPMHAAIRMMYRQRFFIELLPTVVEGFNKTAPEKKQHYLTSLSYMLRFLPKQVLMSELPPLVPMLVQSLLCENIDLQLSTLNSLYDLMFDAPQILSQYMDTILPQMLLLCKYKPSMKVRIVAVQCIGSMSTLPAHVVAPHTSKVLRELGAVLGDKKRLVRKEAVKARNEWYMLETKK